jgi:transposase
MKQNLPNWVLKHKSKGIEIRKIKNNYYAYKVKSVWDNNKKRAKKITEKYLGSITEEGLLPPKHKRKIELKPIKEFGNIFFVKENLDELLVHLKKIFPYSYESIISMAILKLCYNSPLKNYSLRYQTSYVSEYYKSASMSANKLSDLLKTIGNNTETVNRFFELLNNKKDNKIAIDLTTIFTNSNNISYAEIGYNSKKIYHEQLQFLMLYSITQQVPTFFKVLPGSIRDVSSLINAMKESKCTDVVLVTDRGFTSEDNWKFLDENHLKYIFPLRKNSSILNYNYLKHNSYFRYREKHIFYREYKYEDKRIIQFLDKKLMVEEENTFLKLVEIGERTIDEYNIKKETFGIISILTNTKLESEEVYELYKSRNDIEVLFGTMKHTLDDDKTYMQSTSKVRGYFFITFLALYLYSKIQIILKEKELLKKYSVKDVLLHLSKIYKIKVNNEELLSEVPKQTRTLMNKLDLHIT